MVFNNRLEPDPAKYLDPHPNSVNTDPKLRSKSFMRVLPGTRAPFEDIHEMW
jgi:hypothetical protein